MGVLQDFDLLTTAGKERIVEEGHLTYGSEVVVLVEIRRRGRGLDQIFPSLPLHPGGGRWLRRHDPPALDAHSPREFLRVELF